MDDLTFRQYKTEDREAVYALHVLGLKQTGAYIDEPGMREKWDYDLHHIEEVYLNGQGEFLVVLLGERIIGMGALRKYDERTAEIKRMRVHPDFQRRGIGRTLLAMLTEKAKEMGYTRLVLDTTTVQTASRQLYESSGFTVFKEEDDPTGLHFLYYEKDI